ncbi:hypothetical protein IU433_05960 [Nocardia puris]|uniref:Uncharacterized protein n=1 Tax=Nocardia puris TaxID=208602 RepID=A0A366E3Z5_9NOCA|nr:hypothetical protein [Nocardia puris]MBF6209504.1 hypothetical protein [Nocardia puris]MBF6366076.1 hypothetical protein [Nocardia puris]MBF6458583.1 hypothetical protein [Nocardia puris]RBO96234.1 hypothetical protein DFR74_101245 [Nocardia puris]
MNPARRLGVSPAVVGILASLGVPRVIAHDLDLVGPAVNAVLVFAPIAVWIGYVLWRRVPNPFLTLLAVGVVYGTLLALTHQILWDAAFEDPPRLGGNLEGRLSPGAEEVALRVFSVGSSLVTGLLLGAITGAFAWGLARVTRGSTATEQGRGSVE